MSDTIGTIIDCALFALMATCGAVLGFQAGTENGPNPVTSTRCHEDEALNLTAADVECCHPDTPRPGR